MYFLLILGNPASQPSGLKPLPEIISSEDADAHSVRSKFNEAYTS